MDVTLGDLKDRIATELAEGWDSDDTRIADAIDQAIEDYVSKPLRGLEGADTSLVTVSGTQSYALPDSAANPEPVDLDLVEITVSGNRYPLTKIAFKELETMDASALAATTSYPDKYAIYQAKIYLYPRPNGAYTLTLYRKGALLAPTADGSSNYWTNEAEALIRNTAKAKICFDHLERDEDGQKFMGLALAKLAQLLERSNKLNRSGYLRRRWPL